MLDCGRIKDERTKRGLTMGEAAKLAGYRTRHDWNKLENGITKDPRISTLYGMAKALRVPIESLLKPDKK
jgi:transcriptional regulator with XRE-family HTH domain